MVNSHSKRNNRKLQVINLTAETFEFEQSGFSISGFTSKNGDKWFSAQIACDNLDIVNVADAVSRLPYAEKAIIVLSDNGIPVRHIMVSEPGLFRLIFRSRKTEARQYQDWVFQEVLPAVHHYGGYIAPGVTPEQLTALQNQLSELQHQLSDAQQVNRWLGGRQGAGGFLESTLPKRDRD